MMLRLHPSGLRARAALTVALVIAVTGGAGAAGASAAPVVSSSDVIAGAAQSRPDKRPPRWIVGFGSIGPVNTTMTAKQAITRLHSKGSSKAGYPYCGIFDLSAKSRGGLTGFAPKKGGKLALLSVGFLFGGGSAGLPKVVQTSKGIRIGTSVKKLEAAYSHKLRTTTDYLTTVKTLPGPKGLAIAFHIMDGKVANIETGKAGVLKLSELCG